MSATAEEAPPAAAHGEAPAAAGKSGKMKLVAIIAGAMLLEGIGLVMFLPKGASHAEKNEGESGDHGHGGHGGHGSSGGHGSHGGHDDAASDSDTVEVPIESFMCTNNKAVPGSIMHITFKLVAIIPGAQQAAFEKSANTDNKARVRQAILKVARSSNMDDLSDPDLSTMKRLFREEINKVLRKSYVVEVVISDFKTIEQ